ncbi:hypothetical protein J2S62_000407 [Enteractinococcus fodinae]|uniref:Uncharacterized protein n=1 Tax=Enteractinococcus fodinae TaxID=684663 RepID=A0ABU2AXR7_9MICC|nr:hypothetical protein [Enteractinococcus fodinae]
MKSRRTRLIGFLLGLFAVLVSVFGSIAWFLTEASSTNTLTMMIVIASFGAITCGFHIWNSISSNQKAH